MRTSRFAAKLLRSTIMTGAALAVTAPAFAQGDEVIVTGSRVTNANLTASSPITQVDAEEFDLTGATRVEDLLNTYPQLAPSFDAFTVNPTTGFATADLRGLGTGRTLVLVNGHRLQPGGIRGEARDLNQIPAALVKRVEVLTGGASAVYGSDAMAGVVNFILDTEFEGFSLSTGISGYWHNNRNEYVRQFLDAANFEYPTGDSGIDGKAYNVDVAVGSGFDGGRGNAMAYFTYRKNDELRQGARDYSSCALGTNGRNCGGSPTAPNGNFTIFDGTTFANLGNAHLNPDNTWAAGPPDPYNFAPINHYQRPDERWTFGSSVKYEVSPIFRPYIETMFANTNTSVQIAESGTFNVNQLPLNCDSPLLGSLCSDVGIAPGTDLIVLVGKRNVEGGPRIANIESNSFRVVTGAEGDLGSGWTYNTSFLYGRNSSSESNINDFLVDRTGAGMLACTDGVTLTPDAPGCYNVWQYMAVTPEAAQSLAASGIRTGATSLMVVNGYVSGDTGITSPWASDATALVAGLEWRKESFSIDADANMQTGNFTGLGGPRQPISGDVSVTEFFAEAGVPLVQDMGYLQSFALDLGYRYSNYSTSGGVHTYKAGATAQIGDYLRLRGGYNRAIRAAGVNELYADTQIALWSGTDPCAGPTPEFTPAQCALTGVDPVTQYGSVPANSANQYNQFIGGNTALNPEKATTYTVGFVATPYPGLQVSVDYYDIKITDRIGTIGASTILRFCGLTGESTLCSLVNRRPGSGDLWLGSDPASSGYVTNTNANFGDLHYTGLDFVGSYSMDALAGRLTTTFVGSYYLKQEIAPLPGLNDTATFDCAGLINTSCQTPSWRHTMRVSYSQDWITGSVRWRRVGGMDYINTDGSPGVTDLIVANDLGGKLPAWNYIDLTMALDVHENASLVFGVNNILDKEPPLIGGGLGPLNANSPGGYDQLGRYLHATVNLRF